MKLPKISMPYIVSAGMSKVSSVIGKKTIIAAALATILGSIFAFKTSKTFREKVEALADKFPTFSFDG